MGATQSKVATADKSVLRRKQEKLSSSSSSSSTTTSYPVLSTLFASSPTITRCDDSSSPPAPPPLPSASEAPPPPHLSNEDDTAIADAARSASGFASPGPYEHAISEGKRLVMLDTFDGFRCDIQKHVSPYMIAIHSFQLGTTMLPEGRKSAYSFATQVADDSSLLMARVDPGRGSVDCRVHKALLGGIAVGKLQANVAGGAEGNDQLMAELDVNAQTWTGNFKYGSMMNGNCYGMNFLQTVYPNVALGGEGMYLAANQRFLTSVSTKISWIASSATEAARLGDNIKSASLPPGMPPPDQAGQSNLVLSFNSGAGAVSCIYKHVVTPNRLTLGAELQFSPMNLESHLLVGAEYKFQRSKWNFCVDSSARLQSILEAKIGMHPQSPSLLLSAEMDHFKDNEMKFGYGINIE